MFLELPHQWYNVGMIKSLIILVLLIIAVGGAALSKPSQASFQDFYAAQAGSGGGVKGELESMAAKEYAKTFTYNDHIVYSDVSKDGKVVFTGVFSHWFTRDANAAKPSVPHL